MPKIHKLLLFDFVPPLLPLFFTNLSAKCRSFPSTLIRKVLFLKRTYLLVSLVHEQSASIHKSTRDASFDTHCQGGPRRAGTAIGDYALDLASLEQHGLFTDIFKNTGEVFSKVRNCAAAGSVKFKAGLAQYFRWLTPRCPT